MTSHQEMSIELQCYASISYTAFHRELALNIFNSLIKDKCFWWQNIRSKCPFWMSYWHFSTQITSIYLLLLALFKLLLIEWLNKDMERKKMKTYNQMMERNPLSSIFIRFIQYIQRLYGLCFLIINFTHVTGSNKPRVQVSICSRWNLFQFQDWNR